MGQRPEPAGGDRGAYWREVGPGSEEPGTPTRVHPQGRSDSVFKGRESPTWGSPSCKPILGPRRDGVSVPQTDAGRRPSP